MNVKFDADQRYDSLLYETCFKKFMKFLLSQQLKAKNDFIMESGEFLSFIFSLLLTVVNLAALT